MKLLELGQKLQCFVEKNEVQLRVPVFFTHVLFRCRVITPVHVTSTRCSVGMLRWSRRWTGPWGPAWRGETETPSAASTTRAPGATVPTQHQHHTIGSWASRLIAASMTRAPGQWQLCRISLPQYSHDYWDFYCSIRNKLADGNGTHAASAPHNKNMTIKISHNMQSV